jgi:6-phosphogluconolactonase
MKPTLPSFLLLILMSLSAHAADKPLVFVSSFAGGEDGAIQAFHLDPESGTLEAAARSGDIANPFFMALSSDDKFLYAVHAEKFGGDENEEVAAYAIEDGEGKLRLLNRQPSHGTATCYLDVDDSGKTLVLANYSSGNVASLPIADDGSLQEAASIVQHEGSSANPTRQKGPNAHSIVVSPDNRYAYAADLGIDKILCYQLNAGAGEISANADHPFASLAPGSGPRHLTFHPDGKYLYAINELLNTITLYSYAADTGALGEMQTISTLPDDFDGVTHTADLKITPDGKYLYGTNRGHDSIAAYQIGEDRKLSLISIVPSLGKGPQNLAITEDGKWLLCANMPASNVAVFAVDSETGNLESAGGPIEITKPACIMIVE